MSGERDRSEHCGQMHLVRLAIKKQRGFRRIIYAGCEPNGVLLDVGYGIIKGLFAFCRNRFMRMVIAQNVTYERVEQTADVVSDVYNDIMNLFRENQANQ